MEPSGRRYNLNMSEIAFDGAGEGELLRRRVWAIVMGVAYVMVNGMDVINSDDHDLKMLGRVVKFFEATNFNRMSPHNELASNDTDYVLASPGNAYIAYALGPVEKQMGIRELPAGGL